MGIQTVAVYSLADKESLHMALADQSVCIGEAAPSDSYLNMERIVSAAVVTKAQAIHPGYGFLAESPRFAALCKKNNIDFIGPSPEVIALMGDKDRARRVMKEAGVPVIPGTDILPGVEEAARAAARIGYPVLIKARSGGGGRGIRVVRSAEELENAFFTASREAQEPSATAPSILKSRSSPQSTSKYSCWRTRRKRPYAWPSGNARSSAITRSWWRNRPRRRLTKSCAPALLKPPWRRQRRWATAMPAP
jgi:acetyl-CoA carboxylase biotin carboxylase subunit